MKIYKQLYYKKGFWGIVKCHGYWRIGFGSGWLEIGGSMPGLHLPSEDALPGKPSDYIG